MSKLVHKINGKDYLLVHTEETKESTDKFLAMLKDLGIIAQDMKLKTMFLWFGYYMRITLLIPVENIEKYNEYQNK